MLSYEISLEVALIAYTPQTDFRGREEKMMNLYAGSSFEVLKRKKVRL